MNVVQFVNALLLWEIHSNFLKLTNQYPPPLTNHVVHIQHVLLLMELLLQLKVFRYD
jgi:hypothetical protein